MWLTGFDVECLSTLYLDKPMKAHTLMQAIARANRVYPGTDCGIIVDYNGMLRSLRQALAQYALGDDEDGPLPGDVVAPLEALVAALIEALDAAENHLRGLGFDPARLRGAKGFERIAALRDAVNALYSSDEAKRRFEIMAREVFARFKALLMEPSAFAHAERHDDVEAIYKKLEERRDVADVTELVKALHRIVNEAIRAAGPGEDQAEGLMIDLSQIDLERLREEFAKAPRKNAALHDVRELVERKLARMLNNNPERMDFCRRYQEIVADYNQEKDRATVEQTFAALVALAEGLDEEQRWAVAEGLTEGELALFDLLARENLSKAGRERLKQASKLLLARLHELLSQLGQWTRNAQTQAEVESSILDWLYEALPHPPFTDEETTSLAHTVYDFVWHQSEAGSLFAA
jgi:type I restriction enzyme R subunit